MIPFDIACTVHVGRIQVAVEARRIVNVDYGAVAGSCTNAHSSSE